VTPMHVKALIEQGLKVIVQPSTRRVFTDDEYRSVGAIVAEDLSECRAVVAVKEVPIDLLLPSKTYVFFSHTIKAQPYNMPLLDSLLERQVRLVDYECITTTGKRGGPRLVAFGNYAGYAGAIDFLRGMGERFLALGFSTPLLHVGSSFMYPSLEDARKAVSLAGETIREKGIPKALCPFTIVITGRGNVSQGALDILKLLPHVMVDPSDLPRVCSEEPDCHKVYLCITTSEHMVRRRDGAPFNRDSYYAEPDMHEPIFQDTILPYCTAIVNGMYWDARFPRLFTQEDLMRHVKSGRDRLLGVCDITCDEDGSVPTKQFTSIENPFFIYNALSDTVSESLDGPGVLFHAVDHLPSELPREASQHFGNCLLPFLPDLAWGVATEALPPPMRGAIVCQDGHLTPDYQYILKLRAINERTDAEATSDMVGDGAFRPHGPQALELPACETIELAGHLFDTHLINRVCDIAEAGRVRVHIKHVEIGASIRNTSVATVLLTAHTEDKLAQVVSQIEAAALDAKAVMRRASGGMLADADPKLDSILQLPQRKVLLLGAGFVSGPLIEYLLQRPENTLTVASLIASDVEAAAQRYGARVRPEVLDITSDEPSAVSAREVLVQNADLVVSLVPATLHMTIAKLAVQHKKHMVTASYVSPQMQELDAEARAAGVLIINEVGLDPGIDHMSAMKMIDEAKAAGKKVLKFSSLCGGLPAPEAAGSSPIGYKFSWSPKGVLSAAKNPARWCEDGEMREIPGDALLASAAPLLLNNAFAFEVLPNRDSTTFADLYGLPDAPSFFRGTLRYRGFSEKMLALAKLGCLQAGPVPQLAAARDSKMPWTLRKWLGQLLGLKGELAIEEETVHQALRARLGDGASAGFDFVSWLGLTSDTLLPSGVAADSPIDVTAQLMQRAENSYAPRERDMVVMQHELVVQPRDAEAPLEKHVATLVEYGEPLGDTAMARTVGLTCAICCQLILDNPSSFGVGVQRPLQKEWYEPVLQKLAAEGISMEEKSEVLPKVTVGKEAQKSFFAKL